MPGSHPVSIAFLKKSHCLWILKPQDIVYKYRRLQRVLLGTHFSILVPHINGAPPKYIPPEGDFST